MGQRLSRVAATAFSLVEFLIYFGILAAVAVLLVSIFLSTARGRGQVQARGEVQQNLRFGMLKITKAIHDATDVNGTTTNSLSLAMADAAKNPTVFDLSGNVLQMTEGTSTAVALTSAKVKVTALTFTYINNPSPAKKTVQTSMTIEYNDLGNTQLKYSQNQVSTASLKQ